MGLERHACPAANLGALWRARRGLACALAIAVFGVGVPSPPRVAAHPPSLLGQSTREAIGAELEAFRARMASAVAKRDAKALQAMYADEFVHTDRAGRRSRLAERLAGIQAGEIGRASCRERV